MGKLEFGLWDSFGVHEMSRSPVAADIYEQHIREVQQAEALGYRSYFIIEHQNSHVGQITAPSVYLCAVAQHTSSIRIGTMIYQLPLHNPMRLAQDAAMLDHLSRGRLEFGVGLGTHEHEFMRWDTPFDERRAMGDEALEIILKAWTEERVTYEGKYWRFDEALPVPKPYQKPHPPVWYAAHSQASLERRPAQLPRGSKPGCRRSHRREVRVVPAGVAAMPTPRADAAHVLDACRARG